MTMPLSLGNAKISTSYKLVSMAKARTHYIGIYFSHNNSIAEG
jgi:hypothetical protein